MNIVELLKEQHGQVRQLLEKLVSEGDRRQRRGTVADLAKAFRLHSAIEEKLVYAAATKAFQGDKAHEDEVLVAYEEHATASRALEALEGTSSSDKRFLARAKVLKTLIEQHIAEEEERTLPEMQTKLGEEGVVRLSALVERKLPALQEAMGGSKRRAKPAARRATGRGARASAPSRGRGGTRQPSRPTRASRATGARRGASMGQRRTESAPGRGESRS